MGKTLKAVTIIGAVAFAAACILSGCSYSSGTHTATTRVIPKAFYLRGDNVAASRVTMQVAEEIRSTQATDWREFGVMTDRKSGVTTDRYGAIVQHSSAEQTEHQTAAVSSVPRHIIWAWMLGGALDVLNEVLGGAFETWSNNDAAVDIKALDTEADLAEIKAMD